MRARRPPSVVGEPVRPERAKPGNEFCVVLRIEDSCTSPALRQGPSFLRSRPPRPSVQQLSRTHVPRRSLGLEQRTPGIQAAGPLPHRRERFVLDAIQRRQFDHPASKPIVLALRAFELHELRRAIVVAAVSSTACLRKKRRDAHHWSRRMRSQSSW